VSGDFEATTQQGEPSYYPKRTPEEGDINWQNDMLEIYNFIRAQTKPMPGAFTFSNGKKIIIWKAQPFDMKIKYDDKKIGQVVEVFSTGDFVVNCNSGSLLVTDFDGNVSKGDIFHSSKK